MTFGLRSAGLAVAAAILCAHAGNATSLPRLTFEELTDESDAIITGSVIKSWSAWDAKHKYIWTHYQIAVTSAQKGEASQLWEIAEPGGVVGGIGMTISGSVSYAPGENVVVFAQRMPNGYLRTTGWGQGKYALDTNGLLHADTALKSADLVDIKSPGARSSSVRTLDGMSLRDLNARVAARLSATRPAGKSH